MSTLLVASGGGHLAQLVQLAPRLRGVDQDFVWVTWDSPQSRSLLRDETVIFARATPPRNPIAVASNLENALKSWRDHRATALVTTGSQLVLPFIAVGRHPGRPCHIIESAARITNLSITAKIASRIPGVSLYTQYQSASGPRRRFAGSVMDGFVARRVEHAGPLMKIVVTLGTMPGHGFGRLISAVKRIAPDGAEIFWQTGSTDAAAFGVPGRETVPAGELSAEMSQADVVIAHAGVGSALAALEVGKCPVLVPRSAARGEHVDDHQTQIANELADRGLAIIGDADDLRLEDLQRASEIQIWRQVTEAPPIWLS
jgi:UDP-N-acetylglucosamine--N-acetylmuramyl-(pentapeptide) pyrophosphoryl-undecaprenol N-acetylglucosamine transferase